MRVAVVGAGIFGVTTALKLAENHEIDLYERLDDILKGASGVNQYRLHRGYHYPRSRETAIACLRSESLFTQKFKSALIEDVEHYYCISKRDTLTSADQFQDFCKASNLEYECAAVDLVNHNSIDLCVRVHENLLDPIALRELCWIKLRESKVKVLLGLQATRDHLDKYDSVVICTYSQLNSLLEDSSGFVREYQYEICEKPIVKLPAGFNKKSVVVMDGPFMCVDPFGRSDLFVLGNVVHAIHASNVGKEPVIDREYLKLIDNGIVREPRITNVDQFLESAAEFIPDIRKAEHVGSMFTVRTVLPHLEKTDARPTLVEVLDGKMIRVFSGKIGTCVEAAETISNILINAHHKK